MPPCHASRAHMPPSHPNIPPSLISACLPSIPACIRPYHSLPCLLPSSRVSLLTMLPMSMSFRCSHASLPSPPASIRDAPMHPCDAPMPPFRILPFPPAMLPCRPPPYHRIRPYHPPCACLSAILPSPPTILPRLPAMLPSLPTDNVSILPAILACLSPVPLCLPGLPSMSRIP